MNDVCGCTDQYHRMECREVTWLSSWPCAFRDTTSRTRVPDNIFLYDKTLDKSNPHSTTIPIVTWGLAIVQLNNKYASVYTARELSSALGVQCLGDSDL